MGLPVIITQRIMFGAPMCMGKLIFISLLGSRTPEGLTYSLDSGKYWYNYSSLIAWIIMKNKMFRIPIAKAVLNLILV